MDCILKWWEINDRPKKEEELRKEERNRRKSRGLVAKRKIDDRINIGER